MIQNNVIFLDMSVIYDFCDPWFCDGSGAVLLLWFLTVACSWCLCLCFGSAVVLVACFVDFWWLGGRLFGRRLFVRFAAGAFRGLPSFYVFSYFPFGFEGRMWDLIVSVPDHCLSFYFIQLWFVTNTTSPIPIFVFSKSKLPAFLLAALNFID